MSILGGLTRGLSPFAKAIERFGGFSDQSTPGEPGMPDTALVSPQDDKAFANELNKLGSSEIRPGGRMTVHTPVAPHTGIKTPLLPNDRIYPGAAIPFYTQPKTMTKVNFAVEPSTGTPWPAIERSIKDIESGGGNYMAVGKRTRSGDRAYGAYQMMGNNIPDWTEQVLGVRMSPLEFLHNKEAQDLTFRGIMGEAIKAHGLAGAFSTWFTGSPRPSGKTDVNGTVDYNYVQRAMQGVQKHAKAGPKQMGDASAMETVFGTPGGGEQPAGAGGSEGGMMAGNPNPSDQGGQGRGQQPQQPQGMSEAQVAQTVDELKRMSLPERLALIRQFLELAGFKPEDVLV